MGFVTLAWLQGANIIVLIQLLRKKLPRFRVTFTANGERQNENVWSAPRTVACSAG